MSGFDFDLVCCGHTVIRLWLELSLTEECSWHAVKNTRISTNVCNKIRNVSVHIMLKPSRM